MICLKLRPSNLIWPILRKGQLKLKFNVNCNVKFLFIFTGEMFQTPGPGAYSPEKASPLSTRPPSYTIGSRTRYRSVDAVPAPNRWTRHCFVVLVNDSTIIFFQPKCVCLFPENGQFSPVWVKTVFVRIYNYGRNLWVLLRWNVSEA